MDIVDRLVAYKDYTGLTNSQFADRAGIPRPTLSQFLNGRNKRLSDDMTAKLHAAYPDLNVMWLLFGEGSMVNDENIEISEPKNATEMPGLPFEGPENKTISTEEPVEKKVTDFVPKQIPTDPNKRIRSILVCYSDNSYELIERQ